MPGASRFRAASTLARRLASGHFVVTTELTPPVSSDPAQLLARARALKGHATAVNVTDGAGAKVHMSSMAACSILLRDGIEPIMQMTCRDRNRIALQGDLLGALALGIRNVLVLGGDDPKFGDQPVAKPVFDYDSRALLAVANRIRSERELPTGAEVGGEVDLFLGAVDVPVDPPPGWNPGALFAKAEAGADFIQTQFCMDLGVVRRYAARLLDLGLAQRLPVIIGICPIPSVRSALWMRQKLFGSIIPDEVVERLEKASDPRLEGKRICIELLRELAQIPGISGAHIMAPQNPSVVPEVIAESGVGNLMHAPA